MTDLEDRMSTGWRVACATAGPVALGGVLATRLASVEPVIALPAIVLGVTAVTVPALYIATAATGSAPSAERMASAVGRALAAIGLVLLGLATPVWFLVATSSEMFTAVALGSATLAAAALFGLAALYRTLFTGQVPSLVRDGLFLTWALVALVIGARLYGDLAIGAVS
jgi:hypothetical protein